MVTDFLSAVDNYILAPIRTGSGYNPVNTVVLAVLFYLLAVAVFWLLKKWKIKMADFAKAFFPFIILGGVVRSLTDAAVYPRNPFLVTPGIYLVIAAIFLLSIWIEKITRRRICWWVGWVLVAGNLLLVRSARVEVIAGTIAVAGVAFLIVLFALRQLKWKFMQDRLNQAALGAHLFEAAATFVAIDFFGYGEQHVIASTLIGFSGTAASLLVLKAVVVPIILLFAQELEQDERVYITTLILALGLGPGIRDMLTAAMGV